MSFDWGNFGTKVAQLGLPILGSLLPIPGGAAIGARLGEAIGLGKDAKPEEVLAALTGDSEALQKAKEFEMTNHKELVQLQLQHDLETHKQDVEALKTVNATMQTELANSANEEWYQKAWRPANGFAIATGSFVAVFFTCILFWRAITAKDLGAISAIPQLAAAIAMILSVPGAAVGIAAWHRGVEKRLKAGEPSADKNIETLVNKI